MSEVELCQDCFYKYRIDPFKTCTCGGKKVRATWNDERVRYETTAMSIRPLPDNLRGKVRTYVAMCDPYKGTCRREKCTFAHGKAEQKAWNRILREQAEEGKIDCKALHGSYVWWTLKS